MTSVISVKKHNLNKLGYTTLEEWLKDPDHIYIGRNMTAYVKGAVGSKWANPFPVKTHGLDKCLELYRSYLTKNKELMEQLHELKGKILGCWCREIDNETEDQICHGDVLVELINEL